MSSPKRKIWFITRPERDPQFHIDALKALQTATNDFSKVWLRNRQLHKRYEEVLASEELKRQNISSDGSGGRTWAAMLRTFGYVYMDETGKMNPTKVGEALLSGKKIRENVSKQILTLQIPNAYFLESGFRPKFNESFKIRPARFLIRLTNQKSLDYFLTKEEITFFALTAQTDQELLEVTRKIIAFRSSSEQEKAELKKEIALEYDHRERSDKGARDYAEAYGDVAHTFMMLCHYTGLVDYIRGDALRVPTEKQKNTSNTLGELEARYPFNSRFKISLERFSQNAGLDVDSYKASPYRNISPATNSSKKLRKVHQLLAEYPLIKTLSHDEVASILESEFSSKEATEYANLLVEHEYTSLNEDFVESYLDEKDNLAFENKSAEVLKAIGFDVILRPKPVKEDTRTEVEILIHVDKENICLIDAKNYREKFTLSASLASHMGSEYIPNYDEFDNKRVHSFGYLTASKWGGERNLAKITEKASVSIPGSDIKGAIISANALLGFLDYCLENNIDVEERKRMFMKCFNNRGFSSVSEMI